jgi:hypothetical protein
MEGAGAHSVLATSFAAAGAGWVTTDFPSRCSAGLTKRLESWARCARCDDLFDMIEAVQNRLEYAQNDSCAMPLACRRPAKTAQALDCDIDSAVRASDLRRKK